MSASPANANTALSNLRFDAAPRNGTIVLEEVGLDVELEVTFAVTFRFKQRCWTKVPNAVFLHQLSLKVLPKIF